MATSIFDDKSAVPTDNTVALALKSLSPVWEELKVYTSEVCPGYTEEWKFYSKAAGWSLVLRLKKRTLFYFIPQDGFFRLTFVLSKKAKEMVLLSDIPERVKADIRSAKEYQEGTSILLDIRAPEDIAAAKVLLQIKLES